MTFSREFVEALFRGDNFCHFCAKPIKKGEEEVTLPVTAIEEMVPGPRGDVLDFCSKACLDAYLADTPPDQIH